MNNHEVDNSRLHLLYWARKKANNPDLEDKEDFALVLDQMQAIVQRTGVASESLADMSQTFDGSTQQQMAGLLSPYRRVRFL